ncbi:MAG: hypothetical protein ACK46Q_07130 [Hyphomonas sp.]
MKLHNAILPLAIITFAAACGDSSGSASGGGMRDPAPSAGGTFQIEITGAETRTLTHPPANSNVSRLDPDDLPMISFRVIEPAGDGSVMYQLMIEVSDVQPGEYAFDPEVEGPPFASYTVMYIDADQRMAPGGEQYAWNTSGTLTLHSLANERLDGQFDVTIDKNSRPGPEQASIRAVGEFSGISIAR